MPTLREIAQSRYRSQKTLAGRARVQARRTWRSLDPGDLSGSWDRKVGPLVSGLTGLQKLAAEGASEYHRKALASQGVESVFDGSLNPRAFAGVAADGRGLDSLLYRPVIETKSLIAQGRPESEALRRGGMSFEIMAEQQVIDAGRVADGVASFSDSNTRGYYRMLNTPSCARCAILAGKFFRTNAGFDRHPRCDCVHVPAAEADDSMAFDARRAIQQGQIRGLSENETRAILDGADPAQVVNARRGMDKAGLYTTEGTTRRGIAGARIITGDPTAFVAPRGAGDLVRGQKFTRHTSSGRTQTYSYRRTRSPRPTPEAIYRHASSRDEALELLHRHGYLLGPRTVAARSVSRIGSLTQEQVLSRTAAATTRRRPVPAKTEVELDQPALSDIKKAVSGDETAIEELGTSVGRLLDEALPDGLSLEDVVASAHEGGVRVTAHAVDVDKARQLTITRSFRTADDGTLYVYHNSFEIGKTWQGKGTATRMNRLMEDSYRAQGVAEIRLNANLDVGGYTWARAGYDWDESVGSGKVSAMLFRTSKYTDDPEVLKQAAEWQQALMGDRENWPTPMDIARLGWTEGAETWAGKRILLGASWDGVKKL